MGGGRAVSALIKVADGAYPHDDYSFLEPGVKAWWGYLGGHTAHAWTEAEVAHLEATGRPWWGVWTAVQGRALTLADAQADAAGALAALTRLRRQKVMPVAYDVEYSTWADGPAKTEAAARQWCYIMRASGYPHALWYGPSDSTATWRATWTGTAPTVLPIGVVGVQYDHALAGDRYDISVFDPALLEVDDMTAEEHDALMALAKTFTRVNDGGDFPIAQGLTSVGQELASIFPDVHPLGGKIDQLQGMIVTLAGKVATLQQTVDNLTVPTVSGNFTLQGQGSITPGG
jgi:hypothetical protein